MSSEDENESVGSVGEEAVKLLSALQGWARESGSDYVNAATEVAAEAASSFHSLNEHIATGGQDCKYCPICQLISTVRETTPEVKQHLSTAATSLMHAAAGIMATRVPGEGQGRRDSGVEKIDLTDGDDWPED